MAYSTSPLVNRFNRHLSHVGQQYRYHPDPNSSAYIPLSDDEVEAYIVKLDRRSAWLTRSSVGVGIAGLLVTYATMFSGQGSPHIPGWVILVVLATPMVIGMNIYSWTVRPLLARARKSGDS